MAIRKIGEELDKGRLSWIKKAEIRENKTIPTNRDGFSKKIYFFFFGAALRFLGAALRLAAFLGAALRFLGAALRLAAFLGAAFLFAAGIMRHLLSKER